MRILIVAPGSRGDVEPYIALGKGLQAAGHSVRLLTHEDFQTLVASHGLDFWPIGGRIQGIATSPEMTRRLEGGNFLAVMSQMGKEARRGAIAIAEGGVAAAQDMDLILAGIGGLFVGLALAEKFGLPVVQAYYIPFTPTRAFPSFMAPGLPAWLGGFANRLTFYLARQVMWQGLRAADTVVRREVLRLPPAPLLGPFGSDRLRETPVLYGYSPQVISPPPDWGAHIHVTGYWFLDPPSEWTPPAGLLDFVAAGPPPVYVGFGSMSSRNPQATAELVLAALGAAGQRAVLLGGWSGLQPADLPDSVLMVDAVPFAWLFPRMAAVVHHGGAGTTAAGLRAGVPSIVVPFFGDQPYWGRRVAELGVGPAPIPRKRLTAEMLARAIDRAVTDRELGRRAAELGARIRAEAGVARAVGVVNALGSDSISGRAQQ